MIGICQLTHKETELKNSHIYPKFAVEWMKNTGTKFQRALKTPNIRLQDGFKRYLLSEEAEQLFSKREKWFAENIFHPYLKDSTQTLCYNQNLFYFSISLLWRILILELKSPNVENFKFFESMKETEEQWRQFLLFGIYPKNCDRIHLILTERILDHDIDSENVDYYFTRVFDGTTVFNENLNFCAIYSKFSRFIFWGLLLNGDESKLEGTRINPINGILKFPQKFAEPSITDFFLTRIKQIDNMPLASEKQQDKIVAEIKKDKEKYINSDAFRAINSDIKMSNKNKKQY